VHFYKLCSLKHRANACPSYFCDSSLRVYEGAHNQGSRVYENQGEQIGRILDHWAIVYFRQLLKTTELTYIFGQLFPRKKLIKFFTETQGWATFHYGRFFDKLIWPP
jgi:hypothetical protein